MYLLSYIEQRFTIIQRLAERAPSIYERLSEIARILVNLGTICMEIYLSIVSGTFVWLKEEFSSNLINIIGKKK